MHVTGKPIGVLALAVVAVLGALGCEATSPDVNAPDLNPFDAGGVFADTLISFGTSDQQTTCTATLPACSASPAECGPVQVLGAPDGQTYTLPADGRIEVAFRCAQIRERGPDGDNVETPDFQILATVPEGASALIEVSLDGGGSYVSLDDMTQSDESFDLSVATEDLPVVRYVRISDTGNGGIALDAIAAL